MRYAVIREFRINQRGGKMEQEMDAFTQKRFELMIEMATKKLHQEIVALKEHIGSLNNEMGSLKSQISRIQFQPQHQAVQRKLVEGSQEEQIPAQAQVKPKKEVNIVDCRPENERSASFEGGAARNSEPVRPRYGDYESKDVSIYKFFYFGRK